MAEITKADVVSFIENMSVLELSELVKELEESSVSPLLPRLPLPPLLRLPPPKLLRRRPSLTLFSRPLAPTRSASSRLFVPLLVLVSRKPKISLTAHRSPLRPVFPRKSPRTPRSNSSSPALKSRSSKARADCFSTSAKAASCGLGSSILVPNPYPLAPNNLGEGTKSRGLEAS